MCANRPLFQQTGLKKSGKITVWGLQKGFGRLHVQHLGGVFHHIKCSSLLEERFSDEPTSKKFGDLRHFCKSDLELYKQLLKIKIQDQNKKF